MGRGKRVSLLAPGRGPVEVPFWCLLRERGSEPLPTTDEDVSDLGRKDEAVTVPETVQSRNGAKREGAGPDSLQPIPFPFPSTLCTLLTHRPSDLSAPMALTPPWALPRRSCHFPNPSASGPTPKCSGPPVGLPLTPFLLDKHPLALPVLDLPPAPQGSAVRPRPQR